MCDYSLHGVSTRPAKVGDKLISTRFLNSLTRGFAATEDPSVAVCLLPGTELAFEQEVESHPKFTIVAQRDSVALSFPAPILADRTERIERVDDGLLPKPRPRG